MGEAKRNRYTTEFKFKVAIEAVKGEKQLSEIAAEYKVHQTMISNWKKQLLENGASVFETKAQKATGDTDEGKEELIKTIGKQAVRIDWLKKKLGISESWNVGL